MASPSVAPHPTHTRVTITTSFRQQDPHQTEHNRSYSSSSAGSMESNLGYIKTLPGILKIAQMIASVITFSCSLAAQWSMMGGGWVECLGFTSLVCSGVWFILHLLKIAPISSKRHPIEFITSLVLALCYASAAILASIRSCQFIVDSWGLVGATACFAFIAMGAYGLETIYLMRLWGRHEDFKLREEPRGPRIVVEASTPLNNRPSGTSGASRPTNAPSNSEEAYANASERPTGSIGRRSTPIPPVPETLTISGGAASSRPTTSLAARPTPPIPTESIERRSEAANRSAAATYETAGEDEYANYDGYAREPEIPPSRKLHC